tara:strand:+ start:56 stop:376 length:321 start_codon:yes stop_codon:yes gene_type:complete
MYTYTPTKLPPFDRPWSREERQILTPDLPFWWFLNPWKTCEDLQLSLLNAVEEHRKDSKERDEATELQRQTVYDMQNELETVKAERDAANQAVRFLRNKRKNSSRK